MVDLRVALVGTGKIANDRHLPVLTSSAGVNVVSLCDRDEFSLAQTAERFGVEQTYTNVEEMLDKERPDAVFVTVSVLAVTKVAGICLERQFNTFLEKPPGLTALETRQLAELAARSGTINMVGFNRRFRPLVQQAKKVVEARGPICSVLTEFHAQDMITLREAGKHTDESLRHFLAANSVHGIDLLRYLAGDEPQTVAAASRAVSLPGYLDCASAMVRFRNGVVGHVMSNHLAGGGERAEIWGDRICAWVDNGHRRLTIRVGGAATPDVVTAEGELIDYGGTRAQDEHFLNAVRRGEKVARPGSDLADALNTMALVDAIGSSLEQPGLTLTELPLSG